VYDGPERKKGRWIFFLGLLGICLGNGLFKPNISVMVGNLYEEGNPLKDSAFNIFYMGINVGALFAPLVAAYLRNNFGWPFAFGAAGCGMALSVLIFQVFKRHIAHAEISNREDSLVKVAEMPREEERKRILALLAIYSIVILFWMSFHQNGFTMTLWARDSTGPIFGQKISAEIFQSVNPFFVITLTPLVRRYRDRQLPLRCRRTFVGQASPQRVLLLPGWNEPLRGAPFEARPQVGEQRHGDDSTLKLRRSLSLPPKMTGGFFFFRAPGEGRKDAVV